jgi:hypothetical protein
MNLLVTLVVFLIIPVALNMANRKLFASRLNKISISVISAVFVYIFILLNVAYIEHKIGLELAAFDLNGDGFFSGEEITPAQEEAMNRFISDTGRTFAPFTGAIFSSIYFLIVWLIFLTVSWLKSRRVSGNT